MIGRLVGPCVSGYFGFGRELLEWDSPVMRLTLAGAD
jgi:hypothetical protein